MVRCLHALQNKLPKLTFYFLNLQSTKQFLTPVLFQENSFYSQSVTDFQYISLFLFSIISYFMCMIKISR